MAEATPVWLPIPGWDRYQISDAGQIRGLRGRLLRQFKRPDGYLQVILRSDKIRTTRKVHRLVALAFHGPCPDGYDVRHLDGNPENNRQQNLAYGTPSENEYDKVRHGRHPQASQTHCIHGHEFTSANTYMWHGIRHCRACTARRAREYSRKAKRREES